VPVANVQINENAAPVDVLTLQVGETAQLEASLTDRNGSPLTGRDLSWRSTASSIASVDTMGLVTGEAPGTAMVIASSEGVADTVDITVESLVTALECAVGEAGLNLAVGEAYTATAQGSPVICVNGGAGSEYVLVPFNASEGPQLLQVEVAAGGIVDAIGPPNPALFSRFGSAAAGPAVPRYQLERNDNFHQQINARAKRELTPLIRRGGLAPSYSTQSVSFDVSAVDDLVRYNVNADSACSNPIFRTGRVEAVSQHAVIVADTMNPSGGFTRAEYAAFGVAFDTLVHPVTTDNFGVPADIDENSRAVLFFTSAVNELTPANATSFVSGFFFARDLFPTVANDRFAACASSNEAEMFYLLVPDPNGEVNNNVRTKEFVRNRTVGTVAHEFQHLINASRRLYILNVGGTNWFETVWLNEGLSHIAEELLFYATTPHEPRQNVDIDDLRASEQVFGRFLDYAWSNFGRYITYLEDPNNQSLFGLEATDDDLETRGATWAFLRYAADRRGGIERTLWRDLVDSDQVGLSNLTKALGVSALDWIRAWTASVYTDDAVGTSPEYQQLSWDYRGIITSLPDRNGELLWPTFPLVVSQLADQSDGQEEYTLQGGGASFIRFGVAAQGRAAVRLTSGGVSAPSRLRLTIVRTK
jgi:hypothetical protein